ncbi:hypothetical protein HYFRA_00001527 [Hymenoscyphus fraxineus]|uniref:Short-chain dehydrogenase/reductase 3 n=1 Tax=Hymenoscyphus fraxineus TaxID=746836 RepID=A0A9N9L523_9HELO|nr:hypothetical protein HYFRA_00001527 [Hymenoscyphus fraxineus]
MTPQPHRSVTAPIHHHLSSVIWKSALFALALPSLPRIAPSLFSLKTLNWLWGSTVLYHVNGILSHKAVNGWKRAVWNPENEIVVVTGGSSGIGKLVVKGFLEKGCKVVILDLTESKDFKAGSFLRVPYLTPCASKLMNAGPNLSFFKADVTSLKDIKEAAAKIRKEIGEPTVLINNAGIGFGTTILGGNEETIRKTIDVNLVAHFWTVREFLPAMIKQNSGHIVTIASMASFVTIAQNVDYSCSKVAVLAFHEGLRQELDHRYNARLVRTSIIHPFWVRTPLVAPLEKLSKDFPKVILNAQDVADKIVAQVASGYGGQIVMPRQLAIASLLRGLPTWVQERVRGNQKSQILEG